MARAGLFESRLTLTLTKHYVFLFKIVFTLMFGVVWDYYSSKLEGKEYKQSTPPRSYKTEIKILANPGLD